ncbi:E3 ubiquitin-protein ligase RNF181 homolog [Telopea speciosissima]|uniref:E3 ubiquitin-protein ligase RNF181 homolog n=1 Tax=Telopea speciosissima TaxID=54955 RepID=UPI001CC81C6D|nr:E3 ubiquitin-protein ligase RNF181 homolog [Telopea speciosissima]
MGSVSDFLSKLYTIAICLFSIFVIEVTILIHSLARYPWRRVQRLASGITASTTLLALIDAQHPAIRYSGGGESKECAVCLTRLEDGDQVRELQCKHEFHKDCLDQWLKREQVTCPLCRRYVLPEEVVFEHKQLRSEEELYREEAQLAFMIYSMYGGGLHITPSG